MDTIPEVDIETELEGDEDSLRIPIHPTRSDSDIDRYAFEDTRRMKCCCFKLPYGWGVVLLCIAVLCILGFLCALTYEYYKCLNKSC
jgi:hypothetical protein